MTKVTSRTCVEKFERLTPIEEKIMEAIWAEREYHYSNAKMTYEIQKEFPSVTQKNISARIHVLIKKGYIHLRKEGRIYYYAAAVTKTQYRKNILSEVYSELYQNNKTAIKKELKEILT